MTMIFFRYLRGAFFASFATLGLLMIFSTQPFAEESEADGVFLSQEAVSDVVHYSRDVTTSVTGGAVWISKLKYGGWITAVQILLSVVALYSTLCCLVLNRRANVVPDQLAAEASRLQAIGDWEKLERFDQSSNSTLGRIISFLARHRSAPVAELNVTAGDIATRELGIQTQRAYPILVIATIEPLLGLLGTIFGMIEVFDVVAVAGELGDPSLMASGISKALVTTAVGLLLAIPMLAVFHYFKNQVKASGAALSEAVTDLISGWFLPISVSGSDKKGD